MCVCVWFEYMHAFRWLSLEPRLNRWQTVIHTFKSRRQERTAISDLRGALGKMSSVHNSIGCSTGRLLTVDEGSLNVDSFTKRNLHTSKKTQHCGVTLIFACSLFSKNFVMKTEICFKKKIKFI